MYAECQSTAYEMAMVNYSGIDLEKLTGTASRYFRTVDSTLVRRTLYNSVHIKVSTYSIISLHHTARQRMATKSFETVRKLKHPK